ncbi:SNAP25 homologous protein SNAP33-like [Diospyros lotus]|uniref:SNAP25 homologous protein SNAP33-like n=1 Tax=Diospyros lotus TaxID=55363 RepID=UPI002251D564|nr:SNAP25 homologous protein SNAP33-like [Diospyros lotus]
MSGLKKPTIKNNVKQSPVAPKIPTGSSLNPFDSYDELDNTTTRKTQHRASESNVNRLFDDNGGNRASSSADSLSSAPRNRYRNNFQDSGGLENQSVQELENYAVYRSEETTKTVNNCLKIAEEMREDATKTLVALHQQGEQITRAHTVAADIDHDLSRSEKLLGSLGGIFSKTWKPKKTPPITGPVMIRDDPAYRRGNHMEQRERLGLVPASKGHSNTQTPLPEPTNALQKVEVEKTKQDDALSDISDLLGELKGMAVDMGSEIDRQNEGLGHVQDDMDVLNTRVLDANRRGRHMLGK